MWNVKTHHIPSSPEVTLCVKELTSSNGGLDLRRIEQQLLGGGGHCDLLSSSADVQSHITIMRVWRLVPAVCLKTAFVAEEEPWWWCSCGGSDLAQ